MFTKVIQDSQSLDQLIARLADKEWVVLDTEFKRESTYYPAFCLLQLATDEGVACVDPVALKDLGPLLDVIYEPTRLKILHSARQDLELFYNLRGALPAPLFDTQLAAGLAGLGDQIGYGALVERLVDVRLDKAHTRTDWCRRPLSAEQIRYAEDDVRYLPALHQKLSDRLRELGRLHWLDEETPGLLDPDLYRNDPDRAYLRIKRGGSLIPAKQQVLKALTAWRERCAQQVDLPRSWVIKDKLLFELASNPPVDEAALKDWDELKPGMLRRWGSSLLEALHQGQNQPPQALWDNPIKPTDAQKKWVKALAAVVHDYADAKGLSPALLCNKQDLGRMVQGERELKVLQGWRREEIGGKLLAMVEEQ